MKKEKTNSPDNTGGISVNCAFAEMVDVVKMVPNPRNPNQHSENQIALLARIIQHQGFRAPIVVSRRSGFIVAGHGRLAAAAHLGQTSVPVDFQDFKTEADEWAHLLADNRLAEMSNFDSKSLLEIIEEIQPEMDVELSGYDDDALRDIINSLDPLEYTKEGTKDYGDDPLAEKFESEYASNSIRQIILLYDVADYESICADLDKIKDDQNLETNTDAVTYAIRKAGAI